MTHRLFVPRFRPTTLNALLHCHWRTKHRLKEGDKDVIAHYAREAGIPKATGKRRVSITVVMGPKMRRCDPDAFDKVVFDALVSCGLLRDDHPKWLERGPVEQWRAGKGEEWGTWLILDDIE